MFRHEGNGYTIRTDTMNWVLELKGKPKKKGSKNGSVVTKYYGTLGGLLNGLFEHKVKHTKDFDDLREQLPLIKEELIHIMDFDATKGK